MQASGDTEGAELHATYLVPSKSAPLATMTTINMNGEGSKGSVTKMLNQHKTSAELLISGKTTYVPEDGLRFEPNCCYPLVNNVYF